jgi:hypothetical protein
LFRLNHRQQQPKETQGKHAADGGDKEVHWLFGAVSLTFDLVDLAPDRVCQLAFRAVTVKL